MIVLKYLRFETDFDVKFLERNILLIILFSNANIPKIFIMWKVVHNLYQ